MRGGLVVAIVCCLFCGGRDATAEDGSRISFKRTQLDSKFRSEGAAVGDFNHDGKQDIAAGYVYYAAPDWKMHPVIEKPQEYDPHNYSNSFCTFADDLNGDGWSDILVVDFPGQHTWWFENPQSAGGPWKRNICTPVTNNESPQYLDVDGDGKRELLLAYSTDPANPDGPDRWMGFARRGADPHAVWSLQAISAKGAPCTGKFVHGLGLGDMNLDGRNDVLVKEGWWQSPPTDKAQGEWQFHPAKLGEDCAQIYVYDFDGDGDNDVLSSAAHQLGIWWHEQSPDGWKTHLIDRGFSQTHALMVADINSDGLPDFVTGKRYWAHGPNGDVDPAAPAVVFWFELTRKDGKPVWIPHQIDNDSGVGTQFDVADVNGDGLLDVVTSNKKGTHYFEQVRK